MANEKKNIVIVGAGLVGSLLSVYLAKRGHKIDVFEKRPDIRDKKYKGGRSINLALSHRGWTALDGVGLRDKIEPISIPMYGRVIHQMDGTTDFQPYGKNNQAIYSVSRGELNRQLVLEADKTPDVEFHYDRKCIHIDFYANEIEFKHTITNDLQDFKPDLIFGADGAYSKVRYEMQKTPLFDFSQDYLEHGYKELTIPASENGGFRIEKNALHIWPRKSFMLIALPNLDGSFTCTLFAPFKGENGFNSVKTEQDAVAYFDNHFPSALKHMPTFVEDYMGNPTSYLTTMRCGPWHKNKVALIGDASHAIVPFYGQGMNSGFEDCRVFDEVVERHSNRNWDSIFNEYSKIRKPDADAIADLALRNFVEMRDSTADDNFLLRKKLEQFIMKEEQGFVPQYSMVSFTNKRYSEALIQGDKQTARLNEFLQKFPKEEHWKKNEILNSIKEFV